MLVWILCSPISDSSHNLLHQLALPYFLPFLAAIVSLGSHGPVVWSEPSPSSHIGAVTWGAASQLHHGSKSLPSPWPKQTIEHYYEASLLLLICKVTLNGPAPHLPSPSQVYGGYCIFPDTPVLDLISHMLQSGVRERRSES